MLPDEDYVATTHFVGDPSHELWRFSDTAMHSGCFAAWDKRAEFVKLHNETMGKLTWNNGTYHHMRDDGRVESLIR